MAEKKKRKKWIKPRHRFIQNVAFCLLYPYCRVKYGIKIEKFKDKKKGPYLILYNHQTAFDQFFVGMPFKFPIYFVASEDIFSMGFVSKLLKYAVEPIPIKKQTADVSAVLNCMRVAKEGGSICVSPEGNRTFSGRTGYMKDAIVGLIKALKLPVAFVRLEGGFGVHPRWADDVRRGKMRSFVSSVLTKEEYSLMTDNEIFARIESELYVDEAKPTGEYRSKHLAEYIERAYYVCPDCGLSTFESRGDVIKCKQCGRSARYMPDKTLVGIDKEFPFKYLADWYDYQNDFVNSFDPLSAVDEPLYTEDVSLYEVELYKDKKLINESCSISLYGDKVRVTSGGNTLVELSFAEGGGAVTILGKNKLNIYTGKGVYQIKGDKRFCALKYINLYHRFKNVSSEDKDVKFLGI